MHVKMQPPSCSMSRHFHAECQTSYRIVSVSSCNAGCIHIRVRIRIRIPFAILVRARCHLCFCTTQVGIFALLIFQAVAWGPYACLHISTAGRVIARLGRRSLTNQHYDMLLGCHVVYFCTIGALSMR